MAITEPVTVPASPVPRTSVFGMRSVVASVRSPFTFDEQTQEHPGQLWSGDMQLPPIKNTTILGQWRAFFGQLNGRQRRFLFADPDYKALLGAGGGTPMLHGAHVARQATIWIRSLPDAAAIWLPGDYIQIGSGTSARLHLILEQVDGNGSPAGETNVAIWPSLRTSYSDGESITAGPTARGIFRLASNEINWEGDAAKIIGFQFPIVEAL